jgi:hypothetical protein
MYFVGYITHRSVGVDSSRVLYQICLKIEGGWVPVTVESIYITAD